MHSRCDLCGADLQEGDVDLDALFVKCSSCGGLYALLRSDAERMREERRSPAPQAPEATGEAEAVTEDTSGGLGRDWERVVEGDTLRLTYHWYSPFIWLLVPVMLCFGVGAVAALAGLTKVKGGTPEELAEMTVYVCLILGYGMLVCLCNRTRLVASPGKGIQVRHGPLPWFILPWHGVRREDIRQLYGQEKKVRRKKRYTYEYELRVLRVDGRSGKLLGGGLGPEQVLLLERMLEEHLGVKDREVPGELKTQAVVGEGS